jgi:integrase
MNLTANASGPNTLEAAIARRIESQGIDATAQLARLLAGLFPQRPGEATSGATVTPAVITLEKAIEQLLTAKKAAGRREVYLKSLRYFLMRFAQSRNSTPLAAIRAEDVEGHIAKFAPYYRATHLHRLSALFSFAVRRGWIRTNPCELVDRVTIDRKTPRILTPEQCRKVYLRTPRWCRPYLVLSLYAGIRPTEALRLKWEDICLVRKIVMVNAAASKVRQRRVVPLPDCAVRMLSRLNPGSGPVAPSLMTIRRWKRKVRPVIGGWPADILRHTAASYLLAMHEESGKVATWLGNSPGILLSHYNGLALREDAERFFVGADKAVKPAPTMIGSGTPKPKAGGLSTPAKTGNASNGSQTETGNVITLSAEFFTGNPPTPAPAAPQSRTMTGEAGAVCP